MAIGFIVTGVNTSKVIPDRSLTNSSTTTVRVAKFGDGYQQRVADGLNSVGSSFSLSFNNRTKEDIDDIVAFFESKKGVASFSFTYPDTNSTSTYTGTTGSTSGGASTAITMASSINNLNISVGAGVSGTGISGGPIVEGISGVNAVNLTLSIAQNIPGSPILTFTNPNEREVKVICSEWSVGYTNSLFYNLTTTFERVFEA
jgi:phage-related protein